MNEEIIKKGSMTNRGRVEKIVYLTFSGNGWPTCTYSDHPKAGGRGLVCATIGSKNIPIGELKLIKLLQ